mgnify:CR=1 FL=1
MKKIWCLISLLVSAASIYACPACEKQQPKLLRGITHGAGPSSNWDYVIILAAVVVVLATLYFTVKWLLKPGEKEMNHIKRTILNFN